ncbi:hypothetical protein V6N13_076729 [Hibiscus sabdariffa]|uniref:Uncharacterized protein n=2 Tax=Hibiscus sabdariffa TaxID=183260 RepID=A0ABR2B2B5_9ROSI
MKLKLKIHSSTSWSRNTSQDMATRISYFTRLTLKITPSKKPQTIAMMKMTVLKWKMVMGSRIFPFGQLWSQRLGHFMALKTSAEVTNLQVQGIEDSRVALDA